MGVVLDAFAVETELRDQLRGLLAPGVCLHLADSSYWLTPLKDVVDLLKRERIDRRTYRPEVRDCDDFALVLHARMVESQQGNPKRDQPHCFGQVWGMVGSDYAHAINIMLNSDGAVRFVEPQSAPADAVTTATSPPLSSIYMIRM